MEKVLSKPYYIGTVTYKGIENQGRRPTLIEPDLFLRVQAIRASRAAAREKTHKHPHYLKGIFVCDPTCPKPSSNAPWKTSGPPSPSPRNHPHRGPNHRRARPRPSTPARFPS